MKNLFSLLSLSTFLILTGCGGDGVSSGSSERTQWDIRKELMEVQTELAEFSSEHNLLEKEGVVKAEEAYMDMVQTFNQTRREHPELAPIFEEADEFQSQSIQKRVAGDNAGFDELMGKYREARTRLEQKASQLPEMQELGKKVKEAEQASITAIADAAAEVNAEGEKLAKKIKELLAELN